MEKQTKTASQEALGLNILLGVIVLLTLFSIDLASATLITEYKATTDDYTGIRGGVWRGQSFNISNSELINLTAIELNISKIGTPPSVFQINIFATNSSGGITGSPLSTTIISSASVTATTVDTATLKNFTINSVLLSTGKYAWALNATGGDISNMFIIRGLASGTYANGSGFNSATGTTGSWTPTSGDLQFGVYGETFTIFNPSINILSPLNVPYGEIGKVVSLNYSILNATSCYYNYDFGRWSFESNKSEGWTLTNGTVCNRSASCNPTLGSFGVYASTGGNVMTKTFYNLRNISFYINGSTSVSSGRLYLDINGVNVNSTITDGTLSYSNPSNGTAVVTIRTPALTTGIQPAFDGTIDNILINGKDGDAISCSANSSLSLTPNSQVTLFAIDTAGKVESNTSSWQYDVFLNEHTYNLTTIETSLETFKINVSGDGVENILANLIYNGTLYVASKSGDNNEMIFTATDVLTPTVPTSSNVSFYWQINYGSTQYNSSLKNQTLTKMSQLTFGRDVCPANFLPAMRFNFALEQNLSYVNATIDYNFQYGISNSTAQIINGNIQSSANFTICINNTQNYYNIGYGEIQYSATGYNSRRFYVFANTRITNSSINNTLYLLDTASAQTFNVVAKDTGLNPYTNNYISLMRWYPNLNQYNVVEISKTDNTGNAIFSLKLNDVDYRLGLYTLNGSLINLVTPTRFSCSALPCIYTIAVNEEEQFGNVLNIQSLLTYNETTKIFSYFWNDPSQSTDLMNLSVYLQQGIGDTLICSSSASGFTGIIQCDVSAFNGTAKAEVWRSASPPIPIANLIKTIGGIITFIPASIRLFVGFIIGVLMIFIGAYVSPIAMIVFAIISSIFGMFMGIVDWYFVAGYIVVGLVAYQVLKRSG